MSVESPAMHLIEEHGTIRNGLSLYHRSVRPAGLAKARLLILHGYGEHSGRYAPFMRHCAHRGFATCAFDFRGHGRSEGRRGFVNQWDEYLSDLAAYRQTPSPAGNEPQGRLFIIAHSQGGLVAAASAIEEGMTGVAGVILANPYLRSRVPVPWHKRAFACVANHVAPAVLVPSGLKLGWLTSDPDAQQETRDDPLAFRCATPRWFRTVTAAQRRVLAAAARFDYPLLLLLGDRDPIADPVASQQFFSRVSSRDKTLIRYEGFVHELLRETHRQRVYDDVLAWIDQRLA